MIGRRGFITGLISLVAAPAIVRVGSIMPVRAMEPVFAEGEISGLLYSRGPMMDALELMRLEHAERMIHPVWLGLPQISFRSINEMAPGWTSNSLIGEAFTPVK